MIANRDSDLAAVDKRIENAHVYGQADDEPAALDVAPGENDGQCDERERGKLYGNRSRQAQRTHHFLDVVAKP